MPSEDKSSKTEKATPKKRRDEEKKGNIPQSKDIPAAISILAVFYVFKIYISYMFEYLALLEEKFMGYISNVSTMDMDLFLDISKDAAITIILGAGPIMAVAIFVGIVAAGAQTKFKFSKELLKPKFNRLNPLNGIKNMVSMRAIVELIKNMTKIAVIIILLYNKFKAISSYFPTLLSVSLLQAIHYIIDSIMSVVYQIAGIFIAIAAADFFYQRWEYERNIRMSKQELKEEYKQTEGDPQIKGQIKERQRKMSMQRMMQQVPTADVIVRNPTHFAVALKYDIDENAAPIVVAKGQDYLALRIIEVAKEHDIPLKEDRPLARALYANVEIGREIPPEFYGVVANIMAWVYQLKNKRL
ncbi:MAG: flagellar biosynthesis protein FlhB [Clostridiales bacterium]|nr:flagellar biosynthesis protein FlhB [Clostridiales bacterium]